MATAKLAREYLEKQGYLLADRQGNKVTFVDSLLLLTHCAPSSMLSKGICAMATLLEHENASKTVEVVAWSIAKRVNPLVDMMEYATKRVQELVTDSRKATVMMYSMWEEVRDKIQKVVDATKKELQRTVKVTKEELHKAAAGMGYSVVDGMGHWGDCVHSERGSGVGTMSYTAALNSRLPAAHNNTLARTQVRESQVLIDRDLWDTSNHQAKLNKWELVAKANEALEKM